MAGGSLRVCVAGWTGDRPNWGCQATSFGLLEDLREGGEGFDLHVLPATLLHRTSLQRRVGRLLSPVLLRAMADGWPGAARIVDRMVPRLYRPDALRAALGADLVVQTAEGNLDGLTFDSSAGMLLLAWHARRRGRPTISLNQTLFLARGGVERAVAGAYRDFAFHTVREPRSVEFCRRIGLEAAFVPDAAFRTDPLDSDWRRFVEPQPRAPLMVLTGSPLGTDVLETGYVRIAADFAKRSGLQVCGAFWQEKPRRIVAEICREAGGLEPTFIRPGTDFRGLSAVLRKAALTVGGRYHTALKSAVVGTPFVLLPSGTHKSEGLIEMLGYPLPVRAFEDLQGVRSDLEAVLDRRSELSKLLLASTAEIRERRRAVVPLLARTYRELPNLDDATTWPEYRALLDGGQGGTRTLTSCETRT